VMDRVAVMVTVLLMRLREVAAPAMAREEVEASRDSMWE
jgi:hypothetical protein